LRGRLVERVERGRELRLRSRRRQHRRLACGLADRRARDERRGLGRRQSAVDVLPHQPHALEVVQRVQAQATGRPGRPQQAVTTLPRPQQLRADAGALAQLADP
jgi:hypothetical protein